MPFYKGDMLQKATLLRKKNRKDFKEIRANTNKQKIKNAKLLLFLLKIVVYTCGGG